LKPSAINRLKQTVGNRPSVHFVNAIEFHQLFGEKECEAR
jgi:hypothetical protein